MDSEIQILNLIRLLQSNNTSNTLSSNNNNVNTTSGMVTTLIINIVIFLLIMFVFELNRHYKQIYQKRYQKRFIETNRIPPEPSNAFFGWLFAILHVEEKEVLRMVGLDAYMLLRYHIVCLNLCIFLSFFGLILLIPLFGTSSSHYESWDKYTLLNVIEADDISDRLRVWVVLFYAYIVSIYFCQLLYYEYQNFVNERLHCLQANHDGQISDTTDNLPQKYFTVMLEKVPIRLRSADKLYEYFNELFPNEIYTVEISLDLTELNSYSNQSKFYRNKLEKVIATFLSYGKRPMIYVLKEKYRLSNVLLDNLFLSLMNSAIFDSNSTIGTLCNRCFKLTNLGFEYVDAIDFYTRHLIKSNYITRDLQAKCFELSKKQVKDEHINSKNGDHDTYLIDVVKKISEAGNQMTKNVNKMKLDSLLFSSHSHHVRGYQQPEDNKDIELEEIPIDSETNRLHLQTIEQLDTSLMLEEETSVETPNSNVNENIPSFELEKMKEDEVNVINPLHREKSILNPDNIHLQRTLHFINRTKQLGTEKFGTTLQRLKEIERTFELLVIGSYYKYSSTAFVTFKSRTAETISHQMLVSDERMEISHAPNPHDVIWENIAIPKSQMIIRNHITNVGLIIGSIFWSSFTTFVNTFVKSLTSVEQQQNLISVFIILGFLLVLPQIFDWLARYYEGLKLESEIQNSINTRYFYYQLVNIYVTIGLGRVELVNSGKSIFDPNIIIFLLGKTIPEMSLYFCDLLIVKIFTAVPMEMIRPFQLSTIHLLGIFIDRKKCTRRDLRSGAFYTWPMLYGW